MSTHNICVSGGIRYQHFFDEKSALSVAMVVAKIGFRYI